MAYASGMSASSGKYTTSYLAPYQLTVPTTYYFQVDAPLFLPTTAVASLSELSDPTYLMAGLRLILSDTTFDLYAAGQAAGRRCRSATM